MDTIQKGNAAEATVLNRLIVAGLHVLVPFGGGLSFDLGVVVPPEGELLRIQVKCGRVRKGCVRFNTCSTDHGMGRQNYRGRADLIAVYVSETDGLFVIPVAECPSFLGMLRLEAPRNNQQQGIRFARDYTLEAWLTRLGVEPDEQPDADSDHLRHPHAEGEPEAA
jgi:hypothetical protein